VRTIGFLILFLGGAVAGGTFMAIVGSPGAMKLEPVSIPDVDPPDVVEVANALVDTGTSSPEPGTIEGRIVDPEGVGVAGTTIIASPVQRGDSTDLRTESDAGGAFAFAVESNCPHLVVPLLESFHAVRTRPLGDLPLMAGDSVEFRIIPECDVSFLIRNEEGEVVEPVDLIVEGPEGLHRLSWASGALPVRLFSGEHTVRAVDPRSGRSAQKRFYVPRDQTSSISTLTLLSRGSLIGQVAGLRAGTPAEVRIVSTRYGRRGLERPSAHCPGDRGSPR